MAKQTAVQEKPTIQGGFRRQLLPHNERLELEERVKSIQEFNGDATVMTVLEEKFLKERIVGELEKPEDRFASVAVELAAQEKEYNPNADVEKLATEIYSGLVNQEIIYNTPLLLNFARFMRDDNGEVHQYEQLGSACFVLPMDDTIKKKEGRTSIFETVACAADVQQAGGGTGFSGARLRAKASQVKKIDSDPRHIRWERTTGLSSGYKSFFRVLNEETRATTQGNNRRGANMGVQRIDHPDFLDHMYAKVNEGEFDQFNLSMALTDEFLLGVMNDGHYQLKNPIKKDKFIVTPGEIASQEIFEKRLSGKEDAPLPPVYIHKNEEGIQRIINGYTGKPIGTIFDGKAFFNARTVMNDITKLMHHNGEPGVIFIDRINDANPTPDLGEIEATNPCGEQPLLPFEACNLGAINVAKFVKPGSINYETGEITRGEIDYNGFGRSIDLLVRTLDNATDLSDFPLPQIKEAVERTRKIGIGVTAAAEAAMIAKVRLDSGEGIEFCEDIAKFLSDRCRQASHQLAGERGVFPAFEGSIYDEDSEANKRLQNRPMNYNIRVRNAAQTSYAPNGTSGRIVGQKTQGIEPLFSVQYNSNVLGREGALSDTCGTIENILREEDFYSPELIEAVVHGNGGSFRITENTPNYVDIKNSEGEIIKEKIPVRAVIEAVPENLRNIFVISKDINPKAHIDIQAAFQKYCDSGVSKTVNCPYELKVEELADLTIYAYQKGCKGFTVYRSGSRDKEVLISKSIEEKVEKVEYERPTLQQSITFELPVGSARANEKRKIFTTIGYDPRAKRINSVFQAASWGDEDTLRHLTSETRAWSKILEDAEGSPIRLEKLLESLPTGKYQALAKVSNDTTQNAALKSLYLLKFLSEGYADFSEMPKNYELISAGKIDISAVIKAKGNFKLERQGLPAIYPNEDELVVNADYSHLTEICPNCNTPNPEFGVDNGCIKYSCCEYSVCGGG